MKKKIGIICYKSISGGIIVILEYALRMAIRSNFDVYLIIKDPFTDEDFNWFHKADKIMKLSYTQAQDMEFDAVLASFWLTCYDLHLFDAKSYIYFNQSVESKFFDKDKKNKINYAEATYLLGLNIITEATWIKNYIEEFYGKDAILVRNGINKSKFQLTGSCLSPRDKNKLRVLVEGPLEIGFKNVRKAIEICEKSDADEIWLLTSSSVDSVSGVDKVFSRIPTDKVQEIYRSCDVIVKLSTIEGMFGPPLEMFHCGGTAISYMVSGYDEYMKGEWNSLVAPLGDDVMILSHVNQLARNKVELQRLKENAIKTAEQWPDFDEQVVLFESAILQSIKYPNTTRSILANKIRILSDWYSTIERQEQEIVNISAYKGYQIHNKLRTIFKR
ncbi:MAG: hypothetical protein K2Y30_10565 [Flavobacteriaceae bacterium]|nr:hypothetical protein [Flavobacteriaceae bacterium]